MRRIFVTLIGFALLAPTAWAAGHYLKVSPGKVKPGHTVRIYGSVGNGCQVGHKGDMATIFSRAFKGSVDKSFAGIPAFYASLAKDATFSYKIKIQSTTKKREYSISGRCGGGLFGHARLTVK